MNVAQMCINSHNGRICGPEWGKCICVTSDWLLMRMSQALGFPNEQRSPLTVLNSLQDYCSLTLKRLLLCTNLSYRKHAAYNHKVVYSRALK